MPHDRFGVNMALSEEGRRRRDAMLSGLQGEVVRSARRRRRRRRLGAGAAALGLLVAGGVIIATLSPPPATAPPVADNGARSGAEARPARPESARIIVRRVETDAGIASRLRAAGVVSVPIHAVSDAELLETLAELGRPAGLVRTPERVWLTADVTDEPPAPADDDETPPGSS